MNNNFDLKPARFDELMEVFNEFADFDDGEFSNAELLSAANNFIDINRGKVSREKVYEHKGNTSYYAQDTYTVMTKRPWKNFYDYYGAHDFCDKSNNSWNKFNQISKGWI